jgi:hypothetical protein
MTKGRVCYKQARVPAEQASGTDSRECCNQEPDESAKVDMDREDRAGRQESGSPNGPRESELKSKPRDSEDFSLSTVKGRCEWDVAEGANHTGNL